jgi:hypothetical protein
MIWPTLIGSVGLQGFPTSRDTGLLRSGSDPPDRPAPHREKLQLCRLQDMEVLSRRVGEGQPGDEASDHRSRHEEQLDDLKGKQHDSDRHAPQPGPARPA